MELKNILNKVYTLPEASQLKLSAATKEISLKKAHILLRAERVERNIYFIKKGIARVYSFTDATEVVLCFYKEGDTIISMKSYVEGNAGYENIELLEDSELFQLDGQQLQQLYKSDIHIANWGRCFAERELLKTEERLIARQFRSATERYRELLQNSPDLLQRVSLGHIASYVGITQVSLSRIRADIKQ